MTILTTAEYRTIDSTAFNINNSIIHICFLVEVNTLVTLTGTKEVTGHWVILDLLCRTWHTNCSICHLNGSFTQHISGLATTIDIGQNMTATDSYLRVAFHCSCAIQVFTDTLFSVEVRHAT